MHDSSYSKKQAEKLYKEAVAAAVSKDATAMRKLLAEALQIDPSLVAQIKKENVFIPYQNNPYFRRIAYPEDEINKGVEMMYDRNFEGALKFFKNYQNHHPDEPQVFFYVSVCLMELGNYAEALGTIKKNIELDPIFSDAYLNEGFVFEKLERYEEAESSYKKAIEVEPHYANAHYNLGILLFYKLKKYEEAIEAFTNVIDLKPSYVNLAYYKRANLNALLKNKDAMLADLKLVIAKDPKVKESLEQNKDFDFYRNDPEFLNLLQ